MGSSDLGNAGRQALRAAHWPTAARRPAVRSIPLPPLRQHLQELRRRPDAGWILLRNALPLIGVYAFDWPAALAIFSYWLDGLLGIAAILLVLLPRALRESGAIRGAGPVKIAVGAVFTWLLLLGIVGLPYWIALIPLSGFTVVEQTWAALQNTPSLWLAFIATAITRYLDAAGRGYPDLPDRALKQTLRWDVYLLILRAIAMFMLLAHGLIAILLPVMALLLAYFEIWPERALGLVFGDPSRLHEHDPGGDTGRGADKRRSRRGRH